MERRPGLRLVQIENAGERSLMNDRVVRLAHSIGPPTLRVADRGRRRAWLEVLGKAIEGPSSHGRTASASSRINMYPRVGFASRAASSTKRVNSVSSRTYLSARTRSGRFTRVLPMPNSAPRSCSHGARRPARRDPRRSGRRTPWRSPSSPKRRGCVSCWTSRRASFDGRSCDCRSSSPDVNSRSRCTSESRHALCVEGVASPPITDCARCSPQARSRTEARTIQSKVVPPRTPLPPVPFGI